MLDVLSVSLPIFLLIVLGFVVTRLGAVTPADIRALGAFVIRFALPALIFRSLAQRPFAEVADPRFLFVYTLASAAVFAAMFALARALRRGDVAADAIQALGSSVSNSGFIGYPVALLAVGPAASVALALCMVTENIVVIPLALALAESAGHAGKSFASIFLHILGRLARNPLIIAIALGAAASLVGLRPPAPVARSIDMLAAASAPVALFVIGGTLVGRELGGVFADVGRIALGKLMLHPAAVFVALLLAPGLAPDLRKAMLIFASAPMVGVYPLLGKPYGQERVAAAALLVATGFSFLTMSALQLAL